MRGHDPLDQRDARAVHHASGLDRELPPARIALVEARAMRLALELGGLFHDPAVRARNTVRPADMLDHGPSLIFGHAGQLNQPHLFAAFHCPLHTYYVIQNR